MNTRYRLYLLQLQTTEPTSADAGAASAAATARSREWAADYNEIKELVGKTSSKRSAQQTETARFWLMVGPQAYHPLARQMVLERRCGIL